MVEKKSYSMWDAKYNEANGEGKNILDSGAQRWFHKRFHELDEEDQQKVVDNEGYHHGDFVSTKGHGQVKETYKKHQIFLEDHIDSVNIYVDGGDIGSAKDVSAGLRIAKEWIDSQFAETKARVYSDAEIKSMVSKYLSKKNTEQKATQMYKGHSLLVNRAEDTFMIDHDMFSADDFYIKQHSATDADYFRALKIIVDEQYVEKKATDKLEKAAHDIFHKVGMNWMINKRP